MSLIAWYPLNGNYSNKGVGDYSLTVKSSPSYQDNFSLESGNLTLSKTLGLSSDWSYTCWYYPKSNSGYILDSIIQQSENNLVLSLNNFNATVENIFTINQWTHIAITQSYDQYFIYINGYLVKYGDTTGSHDVLTDDNGNTLITKSNETLSISNSTDTLIDSNNETLVTNANEALTIGTTTFIADIIPENNNRRIRDIRFYNEQISNKLVNEIAKGLIIHYKLEDNRFKDCSGLNNDGIVESGTFDYNNETPRYINSLQVNNVVVEIPSQPVEEMSISIWYKNIGIEQLFFEDSHGIKCGVSAEGIPYISIYNGSIVSITGEIQSTKWVQFIGVFKKVSDNSYKLRLYLNGEKASEIECTVPLTSYSAWAHTATIEIEDGVTTTTTTEKIPDKIVLDNISSIDASITKVSLINDVEAVANTTTTTVPNIITETVNTAKMSVSGIYISDFRFFTHALSTNEAKELYKTSAAADDKNNFFAYEVYSMSDKKIYQQGFITFDLEEGNDKIIISKDGLLQINNFYEF